MFTSLVNIQARVFLFSSLSTIIELMSERMTVNNKLKGKKKHGFLGRLKTLGGKNLIKRRRQKGRKTL